MAKRFRGKEQMVREHLRPIERRVLAMRDQGLDHAEIGARIRRSPEHVERILRWSEIPRSGPPQRRSPRAIESRVLALRAAGETHEQIGQRFRRSPAFIRQVEGLAHYQLGVSLLS